MAAAQALSLPEDALSELGVRVILVESGRGDKITAGLSVSVMADCACSAASFAVSPFVNHAGSSETPKTSALVGLAKMSG